MVTFPLLADPAGYRAHTLDLMADPEAREYWIEVFEHHLPSLVRHAIVSDTRHDAADRAEAMRAEFAAILQHLRSEPDAHGELNILRICRLREGCLRRHDFDDPYAVVKRAEDDSALALLPDLLAEIDAMDPAERGEALIRGVFAGNLFDLGAKSTTSRFDNDGFDFHDERERVLARPWVFDDLDAWLRAWRRGPHRRAIVFVDNAGADVVLGMFPLIREMLRRGTQVVVTANTRPALNDITHPELVELVGRIAAIDEEVAAAGQQRRLELVPSGNDAPLIDLRAVSEELAASAADPRTDLVILEGMGRAVETNLRARFTCDALNLAVIKEEHLARTLGGRLYDCVCKYVEGGGQQAPGG